MPSIGSYAHEISLVTSVADHSEMSTSENSMDPNTWFNGRFQWRNWKVMIPMMFHEVPSFWWFIQFIHHIQWCFMNDIQNPLIIFFERAKELEKATTSQAPQKKPLTNTCFFPMLIYTELSNSSLHLNSRWVWKKLSAFHAFHLTGSLRLQKLPSCGLIWPSCAPRRACCWPPNRTCKAQLVKNGKKKESIWLYPSIWNPETLEILSKGPLTYQFYQFSGPLTLMSALSTWAPCIMQVDGTCKRWGDGRSKLVASGPRTGARNGHRPGVSQRDEGHRTWTNRTHRTHRTHGTHRCHWCHQWAHRSH